MQRYKKKRYRQAYSLFWALITLGAFIHLELFFLNNQVQTDNTSAAWTFFLQFPWLLREHIWLAGFWAALIWILNRHSHAVVLSLFIFTLSGLYLMVDQVYYGLFGHHIALASSEGRFTGLGPLWDSFVAELTWVSALNAGLLLIAAAWLLGVGNRQADNQRHCPEQPRVLLALGIWYFCGMTSTHWIEAVSPEMNYVSALLRNTAVTPQLRRDAVDQSSLYALVQGVYEEPRDDRAALQQNFQALHSAPGASQPNVVMLALESVGALQLLPGGQLDPVTTPTLATLQPRMQIFDNLYAPFPSTARSHIPLLTGGNNISWGSVYDELAHAYSGKTLVGHYKNLNYRTGFFSSGDLGYENRMAFYKHLPFDKIVGSNTLTSTERKANKLNSWGVTEEYAWSLAMDWLDTDQSSQQPFFLHYMTVSSHHPYSYPKSLLAPYPSQGNLNRFRNSLFYADTLITNMIEDLKARGLKDNTLLVITGDHGQAFGIRHPGNFAHKNRLYEENLRTFLLIIDLRPNTKVSTHQSSRPGSSGDIAATLFALQNNDLDFFPSQNLLSEHYSPRINYFHKSAYPGQWGLRDGNWKFIGSISGEDTRHTPELYNLSTDPDEQNNLSGLYPELMATYEARTSQWFLESNYRFRAKLTDFTGLGDRDLSEGDFRTQGPKALDFGEYIDGKFTRRKLFEPGDPVLVWTRWVPYMEDRPVDYYWIAPGGEQIYANRFTLRKGWSVSRVPMPKDAILSSGSWTLRLKLDGELVMTGEFDVITH
ncbi:MAG: phosphoglycerol transferase MdoB-like AlkP superfamily enzyme [Halieaceae bacterium]|jgi:phosphoglycerol transferase MdoB-like AlkP superfamily enzyme